LGVPTDERLADVAGRRLVVQELGSTVAAHVVEAVQLPFLVAGDEDRLAGEVANDVVARLRKLLRPSDADPVAPPDPFALLIEDLAAGVVGPGQRGSRLPCALVVPDRFLLGLHAGLLGRDASGYGPRLLGW
jgi:hypothetical protein